MSLNIKEKPLTYAKEELEWLKSVWLPNQFR